MQPRVARDTGRRSPLQTHGAARVRRTAIVFTLIAAGFYFGFIVMMLVRGSK